MVVWTVRIAYPKVAEGQLKLEPGCEFSTEKGRCSKPGTQVLTVGVKEEKIGVPLSKLLDRIFVIFSLCDRHATVEGALQAYRDNVRRVTAGEMVKGAKITLDIMSQDKLGPEIGG